MTLATWTHMRLEIVNGLGQAGNEGLSEFQKPTRLAFGCVRNRIPFDTVHFGRLKTLYRCVPVLQPYEAIQVICLEKKWSIGSLDGQTSVKVSTDHYGTRSYTVCRMDCDLDATTTRPGESRKMPEPFFNGRAWPLAIASRLCLEVLCYS